MYKINFDDSVEMAVEVTTSAADALKEIMDYHHVTQEEFASHIRLSQKQLSFILNRKAFMSIAVAKRIEEATGLDAKWLLQLDLNFQLAQVSSDVLSQVKRFDWAITVRSKKHDQNPH
jgi:plasmid maintenance system antidote protein VapI